MTFTRATRTKTFTYKCDITHPDGEIETKFYFTKKQITDEHKISGMSVWRSMNDENYKLGKKYRHLSFTKVNIPARITHQLDVPTTPSASSVSAS